MMNMGSPAPSMTFAPLSKAEIHEELTALHRIADVLRIPAHERLPEARDGSPSSEPEQHAFLGQLIANQGLNPRSRYEDAPGARDARRAVAKDEIERIFDSVPSMRERFQGAKAVSDLVQPMLKGGASGLPDLQLPKKW